MSDTARATSIEEFAASIAASLASSEVDAEDEVEAAPEEQLPFRERVRRRMGRAHLLVFRVARELFAVELVAVEEAIDMPVVHRLPEMPRTMLGVFTLRGALVSVFTPRSALGVSYVDPTTLVVFCGGERRVALAVDDVDDVLTADLRTVRDAPGVTLTEGSLLGVVHRATDLIGLLDADSVIALHQHSVAGHGGADAGEPGSAAPPDAVKETA
jgi:purine-binding chemotaxis protein CheW